MRPGTPVMTPPRTARPAPPRVVHQLARVKEATVAHPYVMACGVATTSVEPAAEGLDRCARCWA